MTIIARMCKSSISTKRVKIVRYIRVSIPHRNVSPDHEFPITALNLAEYFPALAHCREKKKLQSEMNSNWCVSLTDRYVSKDDLRFSGMSSCDNGAIIILWPVSRLALHIKRFLVTLLPYRLAELYTIWQRNTPPGRWMKMKDRSCGVEATTTSLLKWFWCRLGHSTLAKSSFCD